MMCGHAQRPNAPLAIKDPREIRDYLSMTALVPAVVIAAPFAPLPGLTIQDNIARAVWLSRLAMACGLAPVTPHLLWPVLTDDPDEKDPATRPTSLRNSQAHAAAVAKAGGDMWVLAKPGKAYELSDGCVAEFNTFFVNAEDRQAILVFDWDTAGSIARAVCGPGTKLYQDWVGLPKGE